MRNMENILYTQMEVFGIQKHVMPLGLKHYLHSSLEKKFDVRIKKPYFKDRIENFDDYYSCMQNECNLFYVYNWIQFFIFHV